MSESHAPAETKSALTGVALKIQEKMDSQSSTMSLAFFGGIGIGALAAALLVLTHFMRNAQ